MGSFSMCKDKPKKQKKLKKEKNQQIKKKENRKKLRFSVVENKSQRKKEGEVVCLFYQMRSSSKCRDKPKNN